MPKSQGMYNEKRTILMHEVDLIAHQCLYDSIRARLPHHNYISAHTENQSFQKNEYLWVLDPLVGLSNFSRGNPHFAISVALMIDAHTHIGIIYAPSFNELFTTIKGEKAFLNDAPISVSITNELKDSLLATRFPYDIDDGGKEGIVIHNDLIMRTDGVLNTGSATLDLAYVAAGRIDGFYAFNMNPWDLTGGLLLIEEAGGTVTSPLGTEYSTESKSIIGTNGIIHQSMLEQLSKNISHEKLKIFQ